MSRINKMRESIIEIRNEGKTIEDFIEEVKKYPEYKKYKDDVLAGNLDRAINELKTNLLVREVTDVKFSTLVFELATSMFYAVVDQKLKNEILEEGK